MLSLVIPVFCEESHLKQSANTIFDYLRKLELDHEVVFVDDGSTDTTWAIVAELANENPRVRGVSLSRNFGKEAAIFAGLRYCRGDATIVMDCDLQHPPALIPEMVKCWREQNCEVVDAVKRRRPTENVKYRLGVKIFSYIESKMSGFDLDGASDFKLLDRKVIDAILRLKESRTFYRGLTEWIGYRHAKLYFDVPDRETGNSKWSPFGLMKLAATAITSFSTVPLHLVTILGVVFLVASILFGIYSLVIWFSGHALTGFTTVILLLLIIGSVNMITLGILGEYIAGIFFETKGRPRYVVRQDLNFKG